MKCTFYIDGDVLDPWSAEVASPPVRGAVFTADGVPWIVADLWHVPKTDPSQREEFSVTLCLRSSEDATDLPVRHARRRNRARHT